jgi:hypothetical protein
MNRVGIDLIDKSTVSDSQYDLSRLDRSAFEDSGFIGCLLRHKHLMYDWGADHFFACQVPFRADYDANIIISTDGTPIDDTSWVDCDPKDLHQLLRSVFEGEWGPTARDTISRLLRSGVEVDICNAEKYGPKDPKAFLEMLKRGSR